MKMVKNIFPRKFKMQYWDGKIGLFYFSRHDLFCTYYFIFAGHAESTTYLYTYLSTFHFETFNIRFFCSSYIKGGVWKSDYPTAQSTRSWLSWISWNKNPSNIAKKITQKPISRFYKLYSLENIWSETDL